MNEICPLRSDCDSFFIRKIYNYPSLPFIYFFSLIRMALQVFIGTLLIRKRWVMTFSISSLMKEFKWHEASNSVVVVIQFQMWKSQTSIEDCGSLAVDYINSPISIADSCADNFFLSDVHVQWMAMN